MSPLQLKGYRFTQLQLEGVPRGLPEGDMDVQATRVIGRHVTEAQEWKVDLKVTFQPTEKKPGPYRGVVEAVGYFGVAEGITDGEAEALVAVNGASLLYGAIREMVLIMSSRSSHGEFMLPTVRFQATQSSPAQPAKKSVKKASSKSAQ